MNYIIDGHNLIAGIPGLSLSMPDDEQCLVELLIPFCQRGKHRVEVYFDGAPIGLVGTRSHGRVQAHFVSSRSSADAAIHARLRSMGRSVRSWVVVTSDRTVQTAAREVHAQVLSATEFARLLAARLQGITSECGVSGAAPSDDVPLSEAEVSEWETFFKQGRETK